MTRIISLIAAVAANGAIGFKGGIPWDSPEDRAIFARKTAGGVLVCGRTTAEQMCGVLAQNRNGRDIVWLEQGTWYEVTHISKGRNDLWTDKSPFSIEAVAAHYPDRNVWICGGSRLYAEAMRHPLVTEMHLTFLDCEPDADAFFPSLRFYSGKLNGVDHTPHGHTHVTHGLHSPRVWARQESHTIEGGVHCAYRAYEPNRYGDLKPCLP